MFNLPTTASFLIKFHRLGPIFIRRGFLAPAVQCNWCKLQHESAVHTSAAVYGAKRLGNTKKKIIKSVRVNKKSKKELPVVEISENMTVKELAAILHKEVDHVLNCFNWIPGSNTYNRPNSVIDDFQVIQKVISLSGFRWKRQSKARQDPSNQQEKEFHKDAYPRLPASTDDLVSRPPVVTIMGHVDHGKTTLLDSLRHSNVVEQEFGGITQHIGAFTVKLSGGEEITFLDTPGHAAFHAMRSRGAHVTDIVILVVAADDGVMKQTVESIEHAQDAGVPMIVAINKIDKYEANIEATKKLLMQHNVDIEDYGGEVQVIPISALQGTNIENLKEAIVALAEVSEIKCDPTGLVEGAVIESKTDPLRGKLSTALVQRGTLKKGSVLVAGEAYCKVRGMFDDQGKPVVSVPPGRAVEILGWKELPHAGQEILEVESEKRAREVVAYRKSLVMSEKAEADMLVYNEKMKEHKEEYRNLRAQALAKGRKRPNIYRSMRTKEVIESHTGPELAIVIKGDVDGSVEAILDTLDSYKSDQCNLHIASFGVGDVNPHDVDMAENFNGIVYAFNTGISKDAIELAKKKRVDIRQHTVIYKMLDDLRDELQNRLPTLQEEEVIGEANVLQYFRVTEGKKSVPVAGCHCVKGSLLKKHEFRLERDGEVLYTGKLHSLKHFKTEVESIKTDVECGLSFEDKSVIPQPGDVVVCYKFNDREQKLNWDLNF